VDVNKFFVERGGDDNNRKNIKLKNQQKIPQKSEFTISKPQKVEICKKFNRIKSFKIKLTI
jgi:hypothetical protein